MPHINIQIAAELTRPQKEALVKEMTDVMVRNLRVLPESVNIVIQEIKGENWGKNGELTDKWQHRQINQA